jgi:hypothetical protein
MMAMAAAVSLMPNSFSLTSCSKSKSAGRPAGRRCHSCLQHLLLHTPGCHSKTAAGPPGRKESNSASIAARQTHMASSPPPCVLLGGQQQ